MSRTAAECESAAPGMVCVGRRSPWPRACLAERVGQAVVLAVLVGLAGLGLALSPSATGVGTHCQLGLPPCGLYVTTGRPCPTCGVTTAFVLAAHGRVAEAMAVQPFGCVLFLLVAAGAAGLLAALAFGRSLAPLLTTYGVTVPLLLLVVLAAASWVYKWHTV